jgi:hypothetical protein
MFLYKNKIIQNEYIIRSFINLAHTVGQFLLDSLLYQTWITQQASHNHVVTDRLLLYVVINNWSSVAMGIPLEHHLFL